MPADLREVLDGAAPRHFPELDFDQLWRRHRRVQTRRTATGVAAALLAVLVTGSVIQWGPWLDLQPVGPRSFAGDWESLDLDGSSQQMTIRHSGDGAYQVEIFDDFSTACGGMSATASGIGTLAGDTRMTVTQVYRCEDGTVVTEVEGIHLDEWLLVYDPAADAITDPTDVVWYRPGAAVPTRDEFGAWPVETAFGTFSWTFVPHDAGASRLWNEAISRQPDRDARLSAGVLPEIPAPQITGMNWGEWWEERVARTGDVTIAAVSRHGEIDWSAVYGLEPADDDWLWAEWRHGPSETTVKLGQGWSLAFAVLVANLVPDDPGAVEFRDEESGELVLRLEATDPGVSAGQLFTGDPIVWSLLVDDGDGFRVVAPPWQRLPISGIEVHAAPGGFVAVAAGPADASRPDQDSQLYRWGSADGVQWQALGSPLPLAVDGAVPRQLIGDDDGRLLLQVVDRNERTTLWTSTDGADWQQVGPQLRGWTWLWRTGFGWALTAMDLRCETWLSADGVGWERVPFHPEVESSRSVEAVQCSVLDDDVYMQLEEQAGDDFRPVGLWIGRLSR